MGNADFYDKFDKESEKTPKKEKIKVAIVISVIVLVIAMIPLSKYFFIPEIGRTSSYMKIRSGEVEVGDVLVIGNSKANNTWKVIGKQDSEILVINEKSVATMTYCGTLSPFTSPYNGNTVILRADSGHDKKPKPSDLWFSCGLKEVLNDDYYTNFFNNRERSRMIDKGFGNIFLLSEEEVYQYFPYGADRISSGSSYLWWLRSSVKIGYEKYPFYVDREGVINGEGRCTQESALGVRPVMWLEIG